MTSDSEALLTFVGRPQRVVYFGTPSMAVAPLEALVASDVNVVGVVTGVDKRRGRGTELSPTPVALAARELGIPVVHSVTESRSFDADLGVVVAYGKLIPVSVLQQLPMINVHFSLLPRWRGAAPVERAILAGDATTGVCIMALAEGLDTGPTYMVEEIPIAEDATGESLRSDLVELGCRMLVSGLTHGLATPVTQSGTATYAAKISPEDLHLEWARPASELNRVIRLGGAWTTINSKRFRIHQALVVECDSDAAPGTLQGDTVVCGRAAVQLLVVQPEGKPRMSADDWLRGAHLSPQERLGS